jgi:Spy/CpxP family protein refolding chaperone
MSLREHLVTAFALGALVLSAGAGLRAQEEPRYSPDLEQLRETVSDRLAALADKLGLTDEQKTKIREAHTAFAGKYEACRSQRRELLQEELKALGDVLTPEQREIAKGYVEDFKAAAASPEGPEICPIRETLADRLHEAVAKLNLTAEQKTKLREAHAPFAEKYRAQRAEQRHLVQDELKSVSDVLTPEQREKARSLIEARMANAPVAQSVSDRIHALANHLGINSDQLTKIRDTHRGFAEQYDALDDQRNQLLQEELKAAGEILTPEQREKVSNFFADRVMIVGGDLSRFDEKTITQLRETIADRLHGVADKLGLTAEQKAKITELHEGFIPKYRAQRDQRRELRQKELDALSLLLTADQREKVKDIVGDQFEVPKSN